MKGLLATPLRSLLNVLHVFVFVGFLGSAFAMPPTVYTPTGCTAGVIYNYSAVTWSGGGTPSSTDAVSFVNCYVRFDSDITLASFTVAGGSRVYGGSATVTITDIVQYSDGIWYPETGKIILDSTVADSGVDATVQGTQQITFYDVAIPSGSSVDFGPGELGVSTGSTITNSLELNGGAVVVNAPIYASGSTLIYNFDFLAVPSVVGAEWAHTLTTAVKGVPHHVTVTGSSSIGFGSSANDYTCLGNLTISGDAVSDTYGTLDIENMTGDLNVTGDVVVGSSSYVGQLIMPSVSGKGSLVVGNDLLVGVNGVFTNSKGNIEVARNFTYDAANATPALSTLTLNGSTQQVMDGNASPSTFTIDNLIVNNSISNTNQNDADVDLQLPIEISPGGSFDPIDGSVELTALMTMKSDATGTARIATLRDDGVSDVNGDIKFERFIPQFSTTSQANWSGNSWLAIGNYVTGATLSDWTSSYNNGSGLYVTEYDETHAEAQNDDNNGANAWTFLSSGTDVLESTGLGYYAFTFGSTGDQTLSATGGYNTSDQSETLTYSNGANEGGGWHLLANPFPSPIDGATFISDNALVDGYYVLDNNNAKYVNSSEVLASGTIDVGQSFWVLIPSAGTVDFNTTQISATSGTFVREDDIALQGTVGLRISQEDGRSGQTYVRMHEEGLPEYQFGLDVYYRPATDASNPEVWSVADGDFELLFNAMGDIESTTVVPLNVRSGSEGTVTLEWDSSFPMPEGVCALIEDLETGNVEALGGDPMVVALEANTVYADRFQLTFMNTPVFESSVSHCGGGVIHFNGDESELWNINWSTVSGDLDGTGCASGLESGDYVLEAINDFTQCQVHSTMSIPEVCLGDFNLNGGRDITDLLILLVGLQPTNELAANEFLATDCDCDGAMTTSDLLLFLPYFGTGCN